MAKDFQNPYEQKTNNHMGKEQLASRKSNLDELKNIPSNLLSRVPMELKNDNVGKRIFKQVVKDYQEQNILNNLDLPSLTSYCKAYSRWASYNAKLDGILNDPKADLLDEEVSKKVDKLEKFIKNQVSIMTEKGKELKITARDRINVACSMADSGNVQLTNDLFGGVKSGERRTFKPNI